MPHKFIYRLRYSIRKAVIMAGERSGLLTAAGWLSIISAVFGLPGGLIFIGFGTCATAVVGSALPTVFIVVGIIMLIPSIFAFIGGRRALSRESFGWALVGGIAAILCGGILGILATIFVAQSREEFP